MTLQNAEQEPVTELLYSWVTTNDLHSANQLKGIIYYHLKGIVKKQLIKKNSSAKFINQLPNTTSFLHEVLVQLSPPTEIFDSREQFFISLASFVRWMLLDDLKAKNALKRTNNVESITELMPLPEDPEPYINFDNALSKLADLAPRAYQVALLHYFLGYDIKEISEELSLKKSTVYNELSSAKAYLRTQC